MDLTECLSMDKDFKINILSSAVSTDGHEIENIFNEKGFMAERFVKPPVDIFLDFGFSFCLHEIQFIPSVGSQTSIGIEIYSATNDDAAEISPYDDDCQITDVKPSSSSATHRSSSSASSHVAPPISSSLPPSPPPSRPIKTLDSYRIMPFHRLSRVNISPESGSDVLRFANPRRRSKPSQSVGEFTRQSSSQSSADSLSYELRHSCPEATDVVDFLRIRIFRTKGSTTPALRCLRVVGEPNWRKINHSIRDKLKMLQRRRSTDINPLSATFVGFSSPAHKVTPFESPRQAVNIEASQVENDLLDAITFHVMAIPMLLPSGHNVDLGTLERYIFEEEKWGRPPNDPFTNVPFNAASKPLPNSGLKTRIDKFLADRQDDSIPRTLGRQQQQQQQQHSDITHETLILETPNTKPAGTETHSAASTPNERLTVPSKRRKLSEHETELQSSLDDALARILKSSSHRRQQEKTPKIKCGLCKHTSTEGKIYKLVCGHFICRKCLNLTDFDANTASRPRALCGVCDKAFSKVDVALHHV